MTRTAVVVPTCRPEQFADFVTAWTPHFERHDIELIAVADNEKTWAELPDFIPSRSGAIRSYGLLKAWRAGYDVVNLDDDVRPAADVDLFAEYDAAFARFWPVSAYFDVGHTFGLDEYMRGFPFADRDKELPLIQYGMWDGVPDLDAVTQGAYEDSRRPVDGHHSDRRVLAVPRGIALTGCIMNVAAKHEALPLLYMFQMGLDRVGYDRWDDIWSGLFAKLVCDHLHLPILVNGKASVVHTRASNTQRNYELEVGGYDLNEHMWHTLTTQVHLGARTVIGCYADLLSQLKAEWFGPKGDVILRGMHEWLDALQS